MNVNVPRAGHCSHRPELRRGFGDADVDATAA